MKVALGMSMFYDFLEDVESFMQELGELLPKGRGISL
jgi:hypothetical protein